MSQAPQPPPPAGPPDEPPGEPPEESAGSRTFLTVLAVGGGVIILAVILFLVLRPDDNEPAADTVPTSTEAPTTTEVTTTTQTTTEVTTTVQTTTQQETTTTTPADEPQRVNVRFQNGEVVGGVVEADIDQGMQVVLIVRADVEDEVHLHGYDLTADVAPGQPARITFRADVAGVFEAELEERSIPLAELTVTP
jgi:hypothetical protein